MNTDKVSQPQDEKERLRIVDGPKPATTQATSQGGAVAPNGRLTIDDAAALRKRLP